MVLVHLFESYSDTGRLSLKIYGTFIGVLFLALGTYIGIRLRRDSRPVATAEPVREEPHKEGPPAAVSAFDALTERENEVLLCIAKGCSNREIGERLFISENTVKKHVNNIYSKLGVTRRTQAVLRARELQLIP